MRRTRLILLVGLIVVGVSIAFSWWLRGPVHNGKLLVSWLEDFDSDNWVVRLEAAEAFQQMGTNAVPFLLEQLRHKQSGRVMGWRANLQTLLSKQSIVKIDLARPANLRGCSLAALDALGSVAKEATPALEALLQEVPPDHRALLVLARVGPEGVPALKRALTNDEKSIRFGAQICLEMIESHSEIVFPGNTQESEFNLRVCRFNLLVLRKSFQEYQREHHQELPPAAPQPPHPSVPSWQIQSEAGSNFLRLPRP